MENTEIQLLHFIQFRIKKSLESVIKEKSQQEEGIYKISFQFN